MVPHSPGGRVDAVLGEYGVNFRAEWMLPSTPLAELTTEVSIRLKDADALLACCQFVISNLTGKIAKALPQFRHLAATGNWVWTSPGHGEQMRPL
jgi:hypothetical protein